MNKNLLRERYRLVEHVLGVLCPMLGVLTILDQFEAVQWIFLFLLWMSVGHFTIYAYDSYPLLPYRPFVHGLFVFGVGLMWPLWCALSGRRRRLWR